MRQTLHARSLLVFDTWKVVAFRLAFFLFVCSFPKEFQGLGFRVGVCKCVGAVWTESKFSFAVFGFSDPAALLFLSLGMRSPPGAVDAPMPHQQSQREPNDTFQLTAD